MGRIVLLDEETIGKIAAGEVVERPASVVKELVENSLDAQAKHITIEILGGGEKLIKVVDDGIGMTKEDAVLSLQRHSTSKIRSLDDLHRLSTLGFRGEALPSISAVSQLRLLTRAEEEEVGVEIRAKGGVIEDMREVGLPKGTTVCVENLFFNTPARLKFLKSPQVELAHILAWVQRFALSHHDVSFRVVSSGKEIFVHTSTDKLIEAIASVMGEEIASQMLPVEGEGEGVRIYGFVSPPTLTRTTRNEQFFFVNKRFVRSRLLNVALDEALISALPQGRYPLCVLFIDILPSLVDVNVHPMKLEVKFVREKDMFALVREAVRKAFSDVLSEKVSLGGRYTPSYTPSSTVSLPAETVPPREEGKLLLPWEESIEVYPRIIGQVAKTYIIVEWKDEVMLVDQHAAHERIIFERLLKRKRLTLRESSQGAVFPFPISLAPAQMRLLISSLPIFEELGFEIEIFGKDSILVRAVPKELEGRNVEEVMREIMEDLTEIPGKEAGLGLEEIAAATSCKLAVKAGTPLPKEEMERLLSELFLCDNPAICPHGRPTYFTLPFSEIERRFKR